MVPYDGSQGDKPGDKYPSMARDCKKTCGLCGASFAYITPRRACTALRPAALVVVYAIESCNHIVFCFFKYEHVEQVVLIWWAGRTRTASVALTCRLR